jgi:hypothetical protein
VFRGGGIQNPVTMGQAANRGFALLRAAAGAQTPLHLVVNGQFANPWVGQQALANAPLANAVDVAPYYFYSLNAADSQADALASLFDLSDESSLLSQAQTANASSGKGLDVYEINASTYDGDAPEAQRDPYVAGMASGSALAAHLITAMYGGVARQLVFDLAQYDFYVSSAYGDVMLWGVANSLAEAESFRPTGLALEMLNSAIAGDFHAATASNAGSITAAAFLSNSGWSLAIASANSSPTVLTVSLPANGTPPSQAFTLSGPTPTLMNDVSASNPTGNAQVSIAPITVSGNQVTVPPYGFVVLLPAGVAAP